MAIVLTFVMVVVLRQEKGDEYIFPFSEDVLIPFFAKAGDPAWFAEHLIERRWKEMAGKKWARKLTGDRLAVLDQSQFDANPLLGTLDEIAGFQKKYGFKVPFKPSPR